VRHAALFITFLDVLCLSLLLVGVAGFVAAWHRALPYCSFCAPSRETHDFRSGFKASLIFERSVKDIYRGGREGDAVAAVKAQKNLLRRAATLFGFQSELFHYSFCVVANFGDSSFYAFFGFSKVFAPVAG